MAEETKSRILPMMFGAGAAVLIGVGLVAVLPQPEPAVSVAAPAEPVTDGVTPENDAAPELLTEAPEPAGPIGPSFDTFRVEPDGSMVIAGQAGPGQVVDILLAGEAIARVTADPSGAFVALPVADPSDIPRRLILIADPDGARITSDTSYIVAPIAPPVVAEVIASSQAPAQVAASEADSPVVPPEPVAAAASAEPVVSPPAPPTVLEADADGVRVAQTAPDLTPPNIALDAITYDPDGDVQLAGRATGDGAVQVYIDNQPVTASPVQEGGDWRVDLPEIDTGVYTLRIDEVDSAGEVVSRLETPFRREEAADVAAVLAEETSAEGFEVAVKTVQPGATLWAIAEENLGSGILYVEVFEANADLIRDPDLIYPGQIFRIPDITQ
ncbi:MAG: LysM peptidoglycan-binding domain-containing protein [Pseudomonadota bacterium]